MSLPGSPPREYWVLGGESVCERCVLIFTRNFCAFLVLTSWNLLVHLANLLGSSLIFVTVVLLASLSFLPSQFISNCIFSQFSNLPPVPFSVREFNHRSPFLYLILISPCNWRGVRPPSPSPFTSGLPFLPLLVRGSLMSLHLFSPD